MVSQAAKVALYGIAAITANVAIELSGGLPEGRSDLALSFLGTGGSVLLALVCAAALFYGAAVTVGCRNDFIRARVERRWANYLWATAKVRQPSLLMALYGDEHPAEALYLAAHAGIVPDGILWLLEAEARDLVPRRYAVFGFALTVAGSLCLAYAIWVATSVWLTASGPLSEDREPVRVSPLEERDPEAASGSSGPPLGYGEVAGGRLLPELGHARRRRSCSSRETTPRSGDRYISVLQFRHDARAAGFWLTSCRSMT